MKKDDSFKTLLLMVPELKKVYNTLLPADQLKTMPDSIKLSLQKDIQTFIRTCLINKILSGFIKTIRSDISEYVSDILNLQSMEKLKKRLITIYDAQGLKISDEEAESMIENIDNLMKQVINNMQGENNG